MRRRLLGLSVLLATVCATAPSQAQARRGTVAARDIPRNTVLVAGDLVAPGDGSHDAGGVAPGWVTRRALRAGETLAPPAVEPPKLVHAHAPVALRSERDGITITRRAIALESGRAGDIVRVRLDAQRQLEARVIADGIVTLDLPGATPDASDRRTAAPAALTSPAAGTLPRDTH